jgi:hypothetical protein
MRGYFGAMGNPNFIARAFDWVSVRRDFIEADERPTWGELAAKYKCAEDRLRRAAQEEGWATLRVAHLENQLKNGDAAMALLRAAKMDTAVVSAVTNVSLNVIQKLEEIIAQLESKKSVNTRANTLNTVTFALGNVTKALKEVGVVGIPKALKQAGMEGSNGQWSASMVSALNVTVQNIVGQQPQPVARPAPLAAIPAPSDGLTMPEPAEAELMESDAERSAESVL